MISDADVARKISDLALSIFRQLDESAAMVQKCCSPDDANSYRKSAGKVIYPIVFDLLEPLYQQHPSLKPPNWDDDVAR